MLLLLNIRTRWSFFLFSRVPSGSVNVCSNFLFRIFLSSFLYIYVRVRNLLKFSNMFVGCSFLSNFKRNFVQVVQKKTGVLLKSSRTFLYYESSTISRVSRPCFRRKRGMIDPQSRQNLSLSLIYFITFSISRNLLLLVF